jgi:hypothetical protein
MSDAPLAPTPLHLLRSHSAPISALAWSADNERIYTADAVGKVVVTSTRSLRAIAAWAAHTDSVLGVEEWARYIVTCVHLCRRKRSLRSLRHLTIAGLHVLFSHVFVLGLDAGD